MSQKLRFISKGDCQCQGTAMLTMDSWFVTTWRPESLALLWSVQWTRDRAIAIQNNQIIKETRTEESKMVHGTASAVLLAHTRTWRISLHSQPGLARRQLALIRTQNWTTCAQWEWASDKRRWPVAISGVEAEGVKIFSCDVWTHELIQRGWIARSPHSMPRRQSSRHGWTSPGMWTHRSGAADLQRRREMPAAHRQSQLTNHSLLAGLQPAASIYRQRACVRSAGREAHTSGSAW